MRNPVSRFAYATSDIGMKRSQYSRPFDVKTTMSAGKLYPFMWDEVLPGDTYTVDLASLVRMSTPIHPVLDNCYLDVYFFFVPNRIVWDHWKEFMGESPSDPYINPVEYSVPVLKPDMDLITGEEAEAPWIPPKSLLDYLFIPSGTVPEFLSQLPVRGFCKIWNEWFRDQNLQNAISFSTGDEDIFYAQEGVNPNLVPPGTPVSEPNVKAYWNNNAEDDSYVLNTAHGGDLPPVNKYHDYFTSALINPQKGNPVPIPLSGFAPVYGTDLVNVDGISNSLLAIDKPVEVKKTNGASAGTSILGTIGGRLASFAGSGLVSQQTGLEFNNLGADLANLAGTYATINDLRYAFQLQKFLEAENRGGSRYRELLKAHFGVTSPDASMQVPEFLGGKRIPINMSQVLQTSSTNDVSPQGNVAAYSLTSDKFSSFTKSFTEHGIIFCVGCIRTMHTYAQGIEKAWRRRNRFDYYFPEFANISEQPIYNYELYNPYRGVYAGDVRNQWETSNEIFGYQEAWAEYRYKPNRVTGEFSPTYPQSLDIWHYADYYTTQPYLSSEWIAETRKNIDRTLAVNSDVSDQFICNFYFDMKTTRVMPVNSIPGLADHH